MALISLSKIKEAVRRGIQYITQIGLTRELKRAQRRANEIQDKRVRRFGNEEFKVMDNGKFVGIGTTSRQARTPTVEPKYTRSPSSFDSTQQMREYINRLNSLVPMQDERYRENYIKALESVHGSSAVAEIADRIREINIDSFLRIIYTTDTSIEYEYTEEEKAARLNELQSIWFDYVDSI